MSIAQAIEPPAGHVDTLIVSDLHLGLPASRPQDVLALIESWSFDRLILLGDVFHELHLRHLCDDGWRLVRALRELTRQQRAELVWIEGNHDRGIEAAVASLIGVQARAHYRWRSGGKAFLALHGDCFDAVVSSNARLSRMISALNAWCQRELGMGGRVAQELDRVHERLSRLGQDMATRAAAMARSQACQTVICGHTHLAAHIEIDGPDDAVTYLNAGAWVTRPANYVTVHAGAARLVSVP